MKKIMIVLGILLFVFSIVNVSALEPNKICELKATGIFEFFIPLPQIDIGASSCEDLDILKYFIKLEKSSPNSYYTDGIRIWLPFLIVFLAVMSRFFKNDRKVVKIIKRALKKV